MKSVCVLYRNVFRKAQVIDGKYFVLNCKNKLVDITNKKFIQVPDGIDLVTFSLYYKQYK